MVSAFTYYNRKKKEKREEEERKGSMRGKVEKRRGEYQRVEVPLGLKHSSKVGFVVRHVVVHKSKVVYLHSVSSNAKKEQNKKKKRKRSKRDK